MEINKNRRAFLGMLAASEGTAHLGDNGYNALVGGTTFSGYASHPNVKVYLKNLGIWSTAAGRYQLLYRYWLAYKKLLNLPDFSPASQDAIALQQIKECKAMDDIDAGRFDDAVSKCARIWASLPESGYHQHENSIESLRAAYAQAGGNFA